MKSITFVCNKDGSRFNLESGVTKSEAIAFQSQEGGNSAFSEKLKMMEQFDSIYKSIAEHAQNCDGLIAADVSSYRIRD